MKDTTKNIFLFFFILFFITSIILSISCADFVTKIYQSHFYDFCDRVVYQVHHDYPLSEEEIIRNIINASPLQEEILPKYGITPETIDLQMNTSSFKQKTQVFIIFVLLFNLFTIGILFFSYYGVQKRKLREINCYTKEVLKGNYKLDIKEHEEGELAILKKQLYDMTITLREKNQLLEEDKKRIEQLLADISHQVKTPLTSLNLITDLLKEEIPEEKRQEFLNTMQKELIKIGWLIKNLLNLAKIDSKTLLLKRDSISIAQLLEKSKANFAIISEWKEVSIEIQGDSKIMAKIDEKWTLEAINNLIKNAIEHKAKHIWITYEQNYLFCQIKIQDDGEGIAKKDLPLIFNRFYKAQNSNSDSMGLGLAFVKSIIEAQNGDIKVKSKEGQGTEFIIKLIVS